MSNKPNIIWFIVDQMRGQAMGCNGDPNVFTPNLDNMAIAGTNFPNAVSGYAWRCVVTRDGWKYACVENGEWLLFNLNHDPYEQNNLAFNTQYRKKRAEMKTLLRTWIEKTGDRFPLPQD